MPYVSPNALDAVFTSIDTSFARVAMLLDYDNALIRNPLITTMTDANSDVTTGGRKIVYTEPSAFGISAPIEIFAVDGDYDRLDDGTVSALDLTNNAATTTVATGHPSVLIIPDYYIGDSSPSPVMYFRTVTIQIASEV